MQTTREINMCNKYAPGTESSILNIINNEQVLEDEHWS